MRTLVLFFFLATHSFYPHATIIATSISPPTSHPIGSIILFAGDIAPEGWLFCHGQAVSRVAYFPLFNVIGTSYGSGDNLRTFNLPNFQDRFPLGLQERRSSGIERGGAAHVALTTAHLPAHAHSSGSLNTRMDGGHTHLYDDPGHNHGGATSSATQGSGSLHMMGPYGGFGDDRLSHTHTIKPDYTRITIRSSGAHSHVIDGQSGSQGAGQAFDIMPPYQTINYIIYVGLDLNMNIG